jgi:thiamine-phosphate pyrophosphorylase
MQLIVITSAHDKDSEFLEITRMFEAGLSYLHIRKPKMSKKQLVDYIHRIPKKFHHKLILHTYHDLAFSMNLGGIHLTRKHRKRGKFYHFKLWLKKKSNPDLIISRTFHKMTDVTTDKKTYSYSFLSPVFDSVSQSTLSGGFSRRALHIILPQAKQPVYAMGGVAMENIPTVYEYGFIGAALHGTIWEGKLPPSEVFVNALSACKAIEAERLEM